jgi:hypothetical protein
MAALPMPSMGKKQVRGLIKSGISEFLGGGGSALGGAMAGPAGAVMGRKGGRFLAAKLSKLVGSGDYASNTSDLAVNSLIKPGANQYATFGDSNTSVHIQHREYVRDIFAGESGTFSTTTIPVNPGLPTSFPYLSGIANNFEEYKVNGLVYEVVSTTSPFNSVASMGSIIAAMQYNAANPPFTNKAQMENSDFAISARIDKSIMYGIECKDLSTNTLYIRNRDISNDVPLTSTDVGAMQIAIQSGTGIAANTVIGELWVSYDIHLMRPHITTSSQGGAILFTAQNMEGSDIGPAYDSVNSNNCSLVMNSATGLFANDTFVAAPRFQNDGPVMDLTLIPGNVYRVDIELFSTVLTGPASILPGCVAVGSIPIAIWNHSGLSYVSSSIFYQCNSVNGKTPLTLSTDAHDTGLVQMIVGVTLVGPASQFLLPAAI